MLLKLAGLLLVLTGVVDVFLTVLYARSGAGLLSPFLNAGMWRFSRRVSFLLGRRRGGFLSFTGPTLLLMIMAAWLTLIISGFALMVWPELGRSIQASQGETPKDFASALYFSGFNFTTLGVGDIVPKTGEYRLLAVLEAAMGFSFFTLVITYFLSVYSAIRRRNTFALLLHYKTGGTGKPADFISRLFMDGTHRRAQREFEWMTKQITDLTETHHFYPVLHYFWFKDMRYSVARIALISMDSACLLKTVLKRDGDAPTVLSVLTDDLWTSGMDMLRMISAEFLADKFIRKHEDPPPQTMEEWREHFLSVAERLRSLMVPVVPDLEAGADSYIELRRKWYAGVAAIAEFMEYGFEETIDENDSSKVFRG